MAVDFLLLQRYPAARAAAPRFRHYEWRRPAFTFGYSQKIAFVREQLATMAGDDAAGLDVCRRPTGGGVVDHREDWTYALVIPRGHPLEELRAAQSYRSVHEALAEALRAQGVEAVVKLCETPLAESDASAVGVCFRRAEAFDVVHAPTGVKIAGAAQKRNKHGLLFQGSIWRPATECAGAIDWARFEEDFTTGLAVALGGVAERVAWPELNEEEVSGLTEQYASVEWIEHR
jgi:lipoate-protein ligase A